MSQKMLQNIPTSTQTLTIYPGRNPGDWFMPFVFKEKDVPWRMKQIAILVCNFGFSSPIPSHIWEMIWDMLPDDYKIEVINTPKPPSIYFEFGYNYHEHEYWENVYVDCTYCKSNACILSSDSFQREMPLPDGDFRSVLCDECEDRIAEEKEEMRYMMYDMDMGYDEFERVPCSFYDDDDYYVYDD